MPKIPLNFRISEIAKRVINEEIKALEALVFQIPNDFPKVIDAILGIKGKVILTGMGKSGYIAGKIASSLASTGTPSFYVHPGEASHGDLGMITEADIVVMLSNTGETKELYDIINYCKNLGIKIILITMKVDSTLAKSSDYVLNIPKFKEASSLPAPTTSSLMTLALGDALVICLHEARGFTKEEYHRFHPGGKIGAEAVKVGSVMRKAPNFLFVAPSDSMSELILVMIRNNLSGVAVIDPDNKLLGFIDERDIKKNLTLDLDKVKAEDIMNKCPLSIKGDILASEAVTLMKEKSISALPVIKEGGEICGIVYMHDICTIF